MTKRTGIFDVTKPEILTAPMNIMKERVPLHSSKRIKLALEIIVQQMKVTGYRKRTLKDYETIITNFIKQMQVAYLSEITTDLIYVWLNGMDVSNQTKLTRLKVLKAFLSKCLNNGWIDNNCWSQINVKIDKKVKKAAKADDIAVLLSLIDSGTFIGLRDITAILTMYKTGIRVNTLGQLQNKHIDFKNKVLMLEGSIQKNHRVLKLPLDDELINLYIILIKSNNMIRKHYGERNENLFITVKGRNLNTKSTNNAISKQLSKYAKKYDLKNINAHAIRRAYAKNLYNKGANVALISKALGHADLSVTTQYLDLNTEEVLRDLRDFL